jgi:uncharacterized protein
VWSVTEHLAPEHLPIDQSVELPVPRARGLARPLAALVRFYQLAISPLLRPSCRFAPSCSEYAYEALSEHGAARGSWLALRRLLRCHPFCEGGYDPVPARRARRAEQAQQASAAKAAGPSPVLASMSAPRATSQEAGERLC